MILDVRNPRAKARIQRVVLRLQRGPAAQMRRQMRQALGVQYRHMADLVENGIVDVGVVDQYTPELKEVYHRAFRRIGAIMLEEVSRNLPKSIAGPTETRTEVVELGALGQAFWSNFTTFTTLYSAEKVTRVSQTTKRMLGRLVQQGVGQGKTYKEIAKSIRERDTKRRFNWIRAKRIARTEMHMASNFATEEAVKATGLKVTKEWVAFIDDRTRGQHIRANGQMRQQHEDFLVGGEHLAYPGDPRGSAWNVINCRCVVIHHTREAEEGV
jgi:hypothetical protein